MCVCEGIFSFVFLLGGCINVVEGTVISVPGVHPFQDMLETACHRSSPLVSSSVRPGAAAHLSLVIPAAAFNLAAFFRDPPSLSHMPISAVANHCWG